MAPKDPQADIREVIATICAKHSGTRHIRENNDHYWQMITELTKLFQAHQLELLNELLDEMHPYRTIESMRFLIERKMGELNG